ncbi:CaiB/BaiF CoA transferase family protein [Lacibacterium aquatile]|uniref:CaiB/BaiF CoA transferase family protein n=1 Tax=Lacibacterium aquatile TaxID=1168082 RepID=A0ABW5E1T6_9PROT
MSDSNTGPLKGLRILDLTRILAGPTATQLLGDLGAEVIKIERPGAGDDTRSWGPPYHKDADGQDTSESAYYLSVNRNKHSVAIDIEKSEGQALVKQLLASCDVLVENFKVGGLAKYGLSYEQLKEGFPRLVYCSITGFGQTGPYAPRAGYDYLVQGMGGVMSVTGEADGQPLKVGIAIADIMTGMHASVAILAALRHRDATGQGQQVDLGLLDSTVSWLANQGMNYLVSGKAPGRLGNAHPNIVPYQVFETADGHIILAVGNDSQFAKFCGFAGLGDLVSDPRFATNRARVAARNDLVPMLAGVIAAKPTAHWTAGLEAVGVPCSPINTIDQVFADPHVQAREMVVEMEHPLTGLPVKMIGNPQKYSATPVSYRKAPPTCGEDTVDVLSNLLGLPTDEIERLRDSGVIG